MDVGKYVKGGIWWYKFPKSNQRGILGGTHPCMIVSHVSNPQSACTVLVAPISHLTKKSQSNDADSVFAVPITLPNKDTSYVCCNQITPVVTSDLFTYEGQATGKMIASVDNMMMKYLLLSSISTYNKSLTFEETITEDLDLSRLVNNPNFKFTDCRKTNDDESSTDTSCQSNKTTKSWSRKGKGVYCVETGEHFKSGAEAARKFKISSQTVMNSINLNRPTSDGYQFRRKD